MSNPYNLIQVVLAEEEVINHAIEFKDFSIAYDQQVLLHNLNLEIPKGQWIAILGRSGCGKTTLLKAIAKLIDLNKFSAGSILLNDSNDISYMLQNDSLLPWLTVIDNILLYQKLHQTKTSKANALELLEKMHLHQYANCYPHILSGGMRQRVALARTLIQDKSIVLMDEPFASLDAITRRELHLLCKELLQDKTVIIVTHDPNEALFLTDKIYIMQERSLIKVKLEADEKNHEKTLMQSLLNQGNLSC